MYFLLNQLKKYKSNIKYTPIPTHHIYINNKKISLEYIKNKIKAYESDPYKIMRGKDNVNVFLYNSKYL